MKNKFLFVAFILFSSIGSAFSQAETYVDKRDNKTYKTIVIGTQTWMAENLNFASENSWYYENEEAGPKTHGRLYTWDAANKACPDGWHLPSDDEWKTLELVIGLPASAVNLEGYRGTNQAETLKQGGSSGFNLLMSGYRTGNGSFLYGNQYGDYWTSTSADETEAWYRNFSKFDKTIYRNRINKNNAYAVRCVKD